MFLTGTVVSLTNLASSVARNMERLSLDQDHAQRSEASRRDHPNGLVQGLTQGLSAFGISLLGELQISGVLYIEIFRLWQ